ncbi:MAG TPA: RHS repeat-associated core domain-containing protein [Arenimonas sp.]|uniref:RHS repeat domain-containing protein n=1 Tax=Arenimonas sp. TaxID=1872635 RepID=UPI002D0BCCD8|nr:RHS repeat-associated core domain-containing protein [Arenimonas sp.]HMB57997.1 RHS repeat-associated core domain-containing protein [Arenimonas sp.]
MNFYTGGTSFNATDVSIPGNSGLSVAVGRFYTVEGNHQRAVTKGTGTPPEILGTVQRAFGDWDLDVPYLSTTMTQTAGWIVDSTTPQNRCSVVGQVKADGSAANGAPPVDSSAGAGNMGAHKYWHGYNMHLPGGDQSLLLASLPNTQRPTTGGPYHWTTNQSWWVSCLSATANSAGGEAFLAIAPDGSKYTFNWLTKRNVDDVTNTIELDGSHYQTKYTYRAEYLMLPTRIEDRFGNWVQYTWSNDAFARLQTITSGPVGTTTADRTITLSYNAQGFVSSVTDGTRTWLYTYTSGSLTQVTLPDSSAWQYSLASLNAMELQPGSCDNPTNDPWVCFGSGGGVFGTYTAYVVHPAGARVDFSFTPHFQLGGSDGWFNPLGITQKTISGPGLTTSTWKYAFSPSLDQAKAACQAGACPGRIFTDEVSPDNSVSRRVFGITTNVDETLLLAEMQGVMTTTTTSSGGTPPVTCNPRYCDLADDSSPTTTTTTVPVFYTETDSDYVPVTPAPAYVVRVGVNPLTGPVTQGETFSSERRLPVKTRTTTQQGVTFNWQVDNTCSGALCFDVYANPTSVTRSSAGLAGPASGYSRTETKAYSHDTAKWVIGRVATVTDVTTGKVMSQTDYDATSDLPIRTYSVGALQQTLAYNADGTLLSVTDPLGHVTSLNNWSRGIPGGITFPDTTTLAALISPIGSITRVTNQLHTDTNYGYDVMGRMNRITYPVGDTVAWNDTTRSFAPVATAEYGLPAGHWKQVVQTGNGRTSTFYDAQLHPVLTLAEDTANAATKSFIVTRYDAMGRAVFTSYAVDTLTSVNDSLKGMTTVYDALGRVIQSKQDTDPSPAVLISTTEYLAGFQTRSTNARGNQTTTSYQVFDSPSTDSPVQISLPEGVTNTIARQPSLGKPLSVTRSGTYAGSTLSATRSYVYDDNERLCKTINPESGAAIVNYDAAGNIVWSAEGTAYTSTVQASCAADRLDVIANSIPKITRAYDAMNRVTTVTTPSGKADLTTTYELDGLVQSLAAVNPGTPTNYTVTTTYGYDKRRLLESESSVNGTTTYTLGYGYNANAHLGALTYPDGRTVSYTPDALGRATQVADLGATGGATYASAIHYYPNGAISDFSYGNGIAHTMAQNGRKLPAHSQDLNGSIKILDDTYTFDENGNVLSLTDATPATTENRTRALGYDGLDRLLVADAPNQWVHATYTYDPLDNIRSADQGIRQFRYNYDSSNRLSTIKEPAGATLFTLGYDAQGNTTGKTPGAGCASVPAAGCASAVNQAFVFDSANRMSQVTGQQTYRYDGQGRRVQTTDSNNTAMYWIYSQSGQVLFTGEGRRSQNLSYIYLGNTQVATRAWNWNTGAVTIRYQHTDALGSPVAETDAAGNVVARHSYAPFGEAYTGAVDGTGYTGHVMDQATGLTYAQQRYYDPQIGRFLSVDPVAADPNSGANFDSYWYANNNPFSFTDPDGRETKGAGSKTDSGKDCGTIIECKRKKQKEKEDATDDQWGSFTTWASATAAANPAPTWLVNGSAGTASGVIKVTTLGFASQDSIWGFLGLESADEHSTAFSNGQYGGYAIGIGATWTAGLVGGSRTVFWSGAGNAARAGRIGISLERTPIGSVLNTFGKRVPYPLWKAASATFAGNATGTAIKVGTAEGSIWLSVEKKILEWRGIPYKVVP